ncbi:MAG: AAA family ATPase [Acidobacteria bacterium]|nr:AAA family ATPase [Acidobacteriota bacterium]
MITKIELTNFKSHAHTVIEPGRVTAFVGPNGCGKSSFLEAVNSLIGLLSSDIESAFGDEERLYERTRRRTGGFKISLAGSFDNSSWQISFDNDFDISYSDLEISGVMFIHGTNESRFQWNLNSQSETLSSFPTKARVLDLIQDAEKAPDFIKLAGEIGESFYVKANYDDLVAPSDAKKISPTGKGLASVVARQMTEFDEQHKDLESLLCGIVPAVKRIRVRPAEIVRDEIETIKYEGGIIPLPRKRTVNGHELIFDTVSGEKIPARFMSEGTILILGILTILTRNLRCKTFLIDDIEAGLHPLAQRQLMKTLKDFAEKHDRQIILTSHSPYIIDELDAKDVWVMALDKEGVSHAKRLSDHPDADKVLSVLTTGEFASAYDEEWVVGDTKPAELIHG